MKEKIKNSESDALKRESTEEEMENFLKKKEIQNKLLKKIIEKINKETDK